MEELLQKIRTMRDLAETHNPVIYDLACDTIHYLKYNKFYTHEEVMEILNRKEGVESDED